MKPEFPCFTFMTITAAVRDTDGIHYVMSYRGPENDYLDTPTTEKVVAIIELYHTGIADWFCSDTAIQAYD